MELCACLSQAAVLIGTSADSAASLPFAEAGEISAECLDIQLGLFGEQILVFERGVIALETKAVEEA